MEDNPLFRNQVFPLPDEPSTTTNLTGPEILRAFYRRSGVSYIQIRGKGLFHLGHDTLNLGVPLFNPVGCGCRIYLRIQGDTNLRIAPTDLFRGYPTISLSVDATLFRRNLKPSLYSLDGEGEFLQPVINKKVFLIAFAMVNRLEKVKLLRNFTVADKIKTKTKKIKTPK